MNKTYILLQDAANSKIGKKKTIYAKAGEAVTLIKSDGGIAFVTAANGCQFTCPETFLKVADPTHLRTR